MKTFGKFYILFLAFFVLFALSCGNGGKGSLTVRLELPQGADPAILSPDDSIVVSIYGPDFQERSYVYTRSQGSGSILEIPEGSDRVIKVDEYDVTGTLVARGFAYGVQTGGEGESTVSMEMVPKGWVITVAGGNNPGGDSPDGTLARDALLNAPTEVEFYQNRLIVIDSLNNKIKMVDKYFKAYKVATIKDISIVNKGDIISATDLPSPIDISINGDIYYFSADFQIFSTDLIIINEVYYNSEAGIIILNQQDKMFTGMNNEFFFSDFDDNAIYRVLNGVKEIFVQRGVNPLNNTEGIDRNNYGLINPTGVYFDGGRLYFSDSGNNRIKYVENDLVYTSVGSFVQNAFYEGILVTDYNIKNPNFLKKYNNNFFIYEADTNRILKIKQNKIYSLNSNSIIPTSILQPLPPDSAGLISPRDVTVDSDGNIYIADTGNNAIRMVVGGAL